MNNNPIQSLWVGPRLSAMEILCINSYLANGHEFHLYTYNDIFNVPKETIIKDANEIIPEKDMYIDNFGGYVNLSNQFRFTMLYKMGGWWVDMDTVCIKPFHWGELGITLLSRMIFRNQMDRYIQQPDCFCPIPCYRIDQFISDSTSALPETSYALHLWHNMWKTQQIDKDARFPQNSIYEMLKKKYSVSSQILPN